MAWDLRYPPPSPMHHCPAAPQANVARMRHGRVPDAKAAKYYDYLNREGIERIEKIPGNLGADLMTSGHDGVTEVLVISYLALSRRHQGLRAG